MKRLPHAHRRYHAYRCCLALMERLGRCPMAIELGEEMGLCAGSTAAQWLHNLRRAQAGGLFFPYRIEVRWNNDVVRETRVENGRRSTSVMWKDEYTLPVDQLMGAA